MNSVHQQILKYLHGLNPAGHDAYTFVYYLVVYLGMDENEVMVHLNTLQQNGLIAFQINPDTNKDEYVLTINGFKIVYMLQ